MTISSTTNRLSYAGNGVTVAFATSPVVFFDAADLTVYDVVTATGVSTTKTLTTDYTVTGGSGSTGTVTMLVAPATGHTLVIVRDVAITQGADLVNNDASDAEVQEDALDRLTMIAQQLDSRLDRTFRVSDSDVTGIEVEVPDATTRALTVIGFDADGDIEFYDPASAVTSASTVAFSHATTYAQGSVGLALKGVVNVKNAPYNAVGDGVTDDTAAIQAALTASTSVYIPAGTYKTTASLVTQLDQKIWGAGMEATTIAPTGAGIHGFTQPSGGTLTRFRLSDMSIVGGSTTGSGIYIPTKLAYTCNFTNLNIRMGANAYHLPTEFSTIFNNCYASSATGHGFFVNGGVGTTFLNCYANTITTSGKFGYRSYAGGTFISCNGVDSGTNWGMFGSTVAIDGVDTIFNCVFTRCNIEAFTDIGVRFIYAGYAKFDGGSFVVVSGNYTTSVSLETSTSTLRIEGTKFATTGGTPSKLADIFTSNSNYDVIVNGSDADGIDENGTLRSLPTTTAGYVSWTPTLRGASTAGTNTYTTQSGQYRVDGHMVTAWFYIKLASNSVAMVGALQIAGLPFVGYNSLTFPGSGYLSDWNNITMFSAAYFNIGVTMDANATTATLRESGTNTTAGTVDQSAINATSGYIRGCIQYIKK